jgi:hypothetical protein
MAICKVNIGNSLLESAAELFWQQFLFIAALRTSFFVK